MAKHDAERRAEHLAWIRAAMLRNPGVSADELLRQYRASFVGRKVLRTTVEKWMDEVRREWTSGVYRSLEEAQAVELAQINAIQQMCYDVFYGNDFIGGVKVSRIVRRLAVSDVFEFDPETKSFVPTGRTTDYESLKGDFFFLRQCLMDCSTARRKLLGIDGPVKSEVSVNLQDGVSYADLPDEQLRAILAGGQTGSGSSGEGTG